MELIIEPYKSFGPVEFGTSRDETRTHLGDLNEVMLVSGGNLPIDHHKDKGLAVIFDKYDNCAAVEIKRPSKAIFKDKNLMRLNWEEALAWFKKIDPSTEETHKEFVSWKYGIAFYAPAKNDNTKTLAKTITVFKEDFFYVKNGIPEPDDITSFHIHSAFVEGIEKRRNEFETVESAFQDIFNGNKEFGVLIWNSIPIRFNYTFDLPALIEPIEQMLTEIINNPSGSCEINLKCIAFDANWKVTWDNELVNINSTWKRVDTGYEKVLNKLGEMACLKTEFLSEWKMLLKQCHESFKLSGASLPDNVQEKVDALKRLERKIPNFGKFYSKKDESVVTTNADGRKQVDLRNLSIWQQRGIVFIILCAVFMFAWYLNSHMGNPFWMLEALIPVLMYTFGIGIPISALAWFYMRRQGRK